MKRWKCLDCGHEFTTPWVPRFLVKCPKCGSGKVYRTDERRGSGFGFRFKLGICK